MSNAAAGGRTDGFRDCVAKAICRPCPGTDRVVTLSDQLDAVMALIDQRQKALTDFAQSVVDADNEGHMMPTWMAKDARAALANGASS